MPPSIIGKVRNKLSSHETLNNVLAAQSMHKSGTKHWANSQADVSKSLDKWASQEQNPMIQDLFMKMSTLNRGWVEAIHQHNENMKVCRTAFQDILNQEKAVDVAKKSVNSAQKKAKKRDKIVGSLEKKGKSTVAAETQLRQVNGIHDMCAAELEDTMVRAEEAKSRLVKESLKTSAESYLALMNHGTKMFTAQLELANLIPDDPITHEPHTYVTQSAEIVETALQHSSGGSQTNVMLGPRSSQRERTRTPSDWSQNFTGSRRTNSLNGARPPSASMLAAARRRSFHEQRPMPTSSTKAPFEDHVYALPSTDVSFVNHSILDASYQSASVNGGSNTWVAVPGKTLTPELLEEGNMNDVSLGNIVEIDNESVLTTAELDAVYGDMADETLPPHEVDFSMDKDEPPQGFQYTEPGDYDNIENCKRAPFSEMKVASPNTQILHTQMLTTGDKKGKSSSMYKNIASPLQEHDESDSPALPQRNTILKKIDVALPVYDHKYINMNLTPKRNRCISPEYGFGLDSPSITKRDSLITVDPGRSTDFAC